MELLRIHAGCDDEGCRIEAPPHSAPEVVGHSAFVSWSQDDDVCIVAVSAVPVGVDVQAHAPPDPELLDVADQWFDVRTARRLRLLPPGPRQRVFLRAWTGLEARAKTTGIGLDGVRGTRVRSLGMRHLRIAGSGAVACVALERPSSRPG